VDGGGPVNPSSARLPALGAVQELLEHLEDLPERGRELLGVVREDLERADAELREADARFRALVEQIPAIVYIDVADESMATTYVSPQIEALLGITPQEYLDDPELWTKHLHEDDRDEALSTYLRGRESGEPFTFEYRLIARDGRAVWFRDSAVVIHDEEGRPAYIEGVMLDITERREAEEHAAFLAYHDKLTGLPNKAMFEELLELAIARARRHELAVSVIVADVDDFKLVNDSLGHERGDELIRQLADRLREATRETDLVARSSGDEFFLLLADLETAGGPGAADAPLAIAETVAARVRDALVAPFDLGGTEVYVGASIGIAAFPNHAGSADELMKNAGDAMVQSKRTRPGGYAVYVDRTVDALGKLSLTTRLRKAVEHQHWELHYQPILDLADASTVGVEALLRWNDPNGGLVPPGDFIPLAEEIGLIEVIGDWVVEELVRQDERWRAEGLDLELSFNLSPRQLRQPEIGSRILSRLESGGVDPRRVVVEVTESTAMTDPDRTLRILRDLHARGLRIALDDFGTGYSSLSRLKHMPVDVLKIDRSFVREAHADAQAGSMVTAIVQLADGLGMTSLAEGIETEDERRFLTERGCRLGQGFVFSRPVPAADIAARHRRLAMHAIDGEAV
jgi:diguanylate cyclase (GGDEF)-like protein/PAS domain S-box-containing protein